MQIIQQRGAGDCAVAALATALGWTYEQAAEVCGVALAGGKPIEHGVMLSCLSSRLYQRGIVSVVLAAESETMAAHLHRLGHRLSPCLPSQAETRAMMAGKRGIVGKFLNPSDLGSYHAQAWDGARAWDCRGRDVEAARDLPIAEALIFPHTEGLSAINRQKAPTNADTATATATATHSPIHTCTP